MCIQGVTLSVSLCIALLNPGGAEKIYALVGASGVCIVCYVLPVWFHLRLMHVRRQAAKSQVGAVTHAATFLQCLALSYPYCCVAMIAFGVGITCHALLEPLHVLNNTGCSTVQ